MKRTATLFLLAAISALLLAGCGSSRYVLVTSDYTIHIATSKPELDPAGDTLTFLDENGNQASIPRSQLKQSRELD